MKVLILSHSINEDTPLYGGRNRVVLSHEKQIKRKDSTNILKMEMNTHTSTHIDLPYHFIQRGKTLTDYTPDWWIFKGVFVKDLEIESGESINEGKFKGLERDRHVDFLITRTGFEKFRKSQNYIKKSPVVSSSLAGKLKSKFPNLRAVGFDFISLSSLTDREEGRKAHREFLERDILIVEDMKLSDLRSKPDFVLVSPLFIDKADGTPVSVWAFYDDFDADRCDSLFFDFDGVILDSVNIKTEAFKAMYREHGERVVEKVVRHHLDNGGMSRYKKFKHYHKEFLGISLTPEDIEKLADDFAQIVYKRVLRAKFIEGALQFLELSKRKRKMCFIVSGTPENEIKKIVKTKKLSKYFCEVKGAPRGKGENLKYLIKKYRIDKKKAVLFGDSMNDLKAANVNNIKFVGINYTGSINSYSDFKEMLT